MNDREQAIQLARHAGGSAMRYFPLIKEAAKAQGVPLEEIVDQLFLKILELNGSTPVTAEEEDVEVFGLRYNASRFEITYGNRALPLTHDQRKILLLLMKDPGVVVSREVFFGEVWGQTSPSLGVQMHHVRRVLEETRVSIRTVRRVGYILEVR